MKINKKKLVICTAALTLVSGITINNLTISEADVNTNNKRNANIINKNQYLDTKHKSADTQFETRLGTFVETPVLNKQGEKIKNVFVINSNEHLITNESLLEIRDMVLNSNYKYDEILIKVNGNTAICYNPFSNKTTRGIVDEYFNFTPFDL